MKVIRIADDCLKFMVADYKSGKSQFDFHDFISMFPNEPQENIKSALCLLKKDGFVQIFFADNMPYKICIDVDGIRSVETNTFLKKGYRCLKEIRSLF